jgi:polyphosphate glucokinase
MPEHSGQARAVLMIDVGGTHVKMKISHDTPSRQFDSGPELTPTTMVEKVLKCVSDWHYDVISIGYPGVVKEGRPAAEPGNLGDGWVEFDYASALGKPVRIINDAALQALAAYQGGRMLFVGLGTGTGGALVVDGLVAPMELGAARLSRVDTFFDLLAKQALRDHGEDQWQEFLFEAIAMLDEIFYPDEFVLGGGSAERLDSLPPKCRTMKNEDAYLGALRLWGHGGIKAIAQPSSWRFEAADWHALAG